MPATNASAGDHIKAGVRDWKLAAMNIESAAPFSQPMHPVAIFLQTD